MQCGQKKTSMPCFLCRVFENSLYLARDLMEDSAVPSIKSVPPEGA